MGIVNHDALVDAFSQAKEKPQSAVLNTKEQLFVRAMEQVGFDGAIKLSDGVTLRKNTVCGRELKAEYTYHNGGQFAIREVGVHMVGGGDLYGLVKMMADTIPPDVFTTGPHSVEVLGHEFRRVNGSNIVYMDNEPCGILSVDPNVTTRDALMDIIRNNIIQEYGV